ncbi:MAG: excinuclease ABC subunit UvrA [Muribaculaceae bacterium]|nr:excinuclease ABC subunit UvrA [Muribaculaceae bacterium]
MPSLNVFGARVNNLKNIDVEIPHNSLTVITGVSGSGKSSLAFDTIYAEGQRRYLETLSSYATNLIGNLERPDADMITGLSPVIAIEQKTINRNPRSTVGTATEIYDFLRLLYARIATAVSYATGKPMVKYTPEAIVDLILEKYAGRKIYILAPLVRARKGHYKELFENLRKKGYLNVRLDGEIREITYGMKADRYKTHDIELVIDRLIPNPDSRDRLFSTVTKALEQGDRQLLVYDLAANAPAYFSQLLMDPEAGISYREPAPNNFSFNSPHGACPHCSGLGYVNVIDSAKVFPDTSLSIRAGGIAPLGKYKDSLIFRQILAICQYYDCSLDTPLNELPEEALREIVNGTTRRLNVQLPGYNAQYLIPFDGLAKYIEMQQDDEASTAARRWSGQFFSRTTCPECNGQRLNREALHFFIDGKNIADLAALDIVSLLEWIDRIPQSLSPSQMVIARDILKEIRSRLAFLIDVGLGYLSLSRPSATLSGGESQRIRLATQLGSDLVGVLYILDEPSIGLHQSDNLRLIDSLKRLRDAENTVIVVEHDPEIIRQADHIIDIGPGAGVHGGELIYSGPPKKRKVKEELAETLNSSEITPKNSLFLVGATGNNLRDVNLTIPLGTFTCVAGPSGSGKSSIINSTLYPALAQKLHRSRQPALPYREILGIEHVDKVIAVDQSPLGRSPRSNPATYLGVFTDIRNLFASLPEAKIRGYRPGRFSFNVAGGRCEVCSGNGYRTIEMNFLPDVLVPCDACQGKRYNRETLEVRFKGKSIADVLDMTVDQAVEFFSSIPDILHKIKVLQDVGLGYIRLGQPSSTLSGGENQRVKLAAELARRDTGRTIYFLDEPTTGLHTSDIAQLLRVLRSLVDRGNTVVVIEHNVDVLRSSDYIIDMGPSGGRFGGNIVAQGTPAQVAATDSPTAPFLR